MRSIFYELSRALGSRAGAEILAHFGCGLGVAFVVQKLQHSLFDALCGIVAEHDPGVLLFNSFCDRNLFSGLRIKHHGSRHIQAFGYAVHAAVGDEGVGF